MASSSRTIIGLDFGTTYTGVAIAWGDTPRDIEVITNWPGRGGMTNEKVPTVFSYDLRPLGEILASSKKSDSLIESTSALTPKNRKVGQDVRWGYQFKPGEKNIRCIKLFLDRNQELPSFVDGDDLALELERTGRDTIDAVSDYLAKIHQHILEVIERRCGEALAKTKTLHFVLTVPAMWSDVAKDATREAAQRAGIENENITMISEPEAAAIYTLHDQHKSLKVGNNVVVCDAGGGTVDLISYKITKLSPLTVEEASVGTGGLCGAAFLNCAFENHIRTRLGEKVYAGWRLKYARAFESGLQHFEDFVKRDFNSSEVVNFFVPFPGVPDNKPLNVQNEYLILTHSQVKSMFMPIVDQILALVQGQVTTVQASNGSVSSIILVGGFGESPYLYERIKAHFHRKNNSAAHSTSLVARRASSVIVDQPIEIIQPANAWSAVVRGAALCGMQGSVTTKRRSRYHYGTTYHPAWDGREHPITSRYLDQYDGSFRAQDAMQWYLHKGQIVSDKRSISLYFSESFDKERVKDRGNLSTYNILYTCSAIEAPVMYRDSFLEVCEVEADLSTVPLRCFIKRKNPEGQIYYQLEYKSEMKINSADLSFELKVNGRGYGAATAKFNH